MASVDFSTGSAPASSGVLPTMKARVRSVALKPGLQPLMTVGARLRAASATSALTSALERPYALLELFDAESAGQPPAASAAPPSAAAAATAA